METIPSLVFIATTLSTDKIQQLRGYFHGGVPQPGLDRPGHGLAFRDEVAEPLQIS